MNGEAVRRGRGRPRDPRVEKAVLDAALELFLEKGMDATSIEQIAKRAGVAKLSLYRRWSSKEELVAAALEGVRSGLPDQELMAQAETGMPVGELLETMVDLAADFLTQPGVRTLLARVIGARADHPCLVEVYWNRFVVPRREFAARVIDRARAQGVVPPETESDVLIDTIVGAVVLRLLFYPDPPSPPELRLHLRKVLHQAGVRLAPP